MLTPDDDDKLRYETGATRSKVGEDTRFDLISPIGLRGIAVIAGRDDEFTREIEATSCHDQLAGIAIGWINDFLEGTDARGGAYDSSLCYAGLAILKACHVHRGGDPEYASCRQPVQPGNRWRYDLIPPLGMEGVAETYKEGADKHGRDNWLQGMAVHDLLNRVLRHLWHFLDRQDLEPDLEHAGWGILAAIHSLVQWPHLNNGFLRKPGCIPAFSEDDDIPQDVLDAIDQEKRDLQIDDDDEWGPDDVVSLTQEGEAMAEEVSAGNKESA